VWVENGQVCYVADPVSAQVRYAIRRLRRILPCEIVARNSNVAPELSFWGKRN
jgi:hypothetical protein